MTLWLTLPGASGDSALHLVIGYVFVVHVGGTRGVTGSIDRIIQIHARITWGVALILAIFFHLFLVCLTDMTDHFFQCLTLSG